jgi:hypothetical protein
MVDTTSLILPRRVWRFAAAILAFLASATAVGAPERPAGVVTDLGGQAFVWRGSARDPATILTELGDGDHLELPAGSSVQFIAYWISQAFVATGPARIRVGYSGPVAVEGVAPRRLESVSLPPLNTSGYARPAARSADEGGGLRLLSPVGTRVLGLTPELRWRAVPAAVEYRVSVYSDRGASVHAATVRGTAITLPEGRLDPGKPYGWQVEAQGPDGTAVARAVFSTVLPELAAEARQFRPRESAPVSEWVAYGLWLRQLRFGAEERAVWKALQRRRPEEAMIRSLADE